MSINGGEDVALTDGEEYANVAYNRTLEAGKYGTIVLPFAPDASATDNYAFYELTSNDGETLTFNPFRAYFTTAASSAAKQMRIVVSDETTGIKENYELEIMNSDDAVYDLQGRKVKNPGKGLYIVNGKKVLKN